MVVGRRPETVGRVETAGLAPGAELELAAAPGLAVAVVPGFVPASALLLSLLRLYSISGCVICLCLKSVNRLCSVSLKVSQVRLFWNMNNSIAHYKYKVQNNAAS